MNKKQHKFIAEYLVNEDVFKSACVAGIDLKDKSSGRYYVYLLIDPRDNKIFYVGKGKERRAFQHVIDALSGRVFNSIKHDRIKEILDSNQKVIVKIFSDHLSELDAFKLERELIEVLACTGLANMVHGVVTFNESAIRSLQYQLENMESKLEFLCSLNDYGVEVTTKTFGSPEKFYEWYRETINKLMIRLMMEAENDKGTIDKK